MESGKRENNGRTIGRLAERDRHMLFFGKPLKKRSTFHI
jgi:hypothetical protein